MSCVVNVPVVVCCTSHWWKLLSSRGSGKGKLKKVKEEQPNHVRSDSRI